MKQIWLGMDPGSANFAITVIKFDPDSGRKKTLYTSKIVNPIKNLTANPVRNKNRRGKSALERDEPTFEIGYQLFSDEIEWLFEQYKITHVVGERFQARGMRGDTGETISMMLGIIFSVAKRYGAKIITTTAGVWKKAVEKVSGMTLPELYEYGKIKWRLEPHYIDSALIALWHADRGKAWANKHLVNVLAKQLIKQRDTDAL
jgi:hypothetical protein